MVALESILLVFIAGLITDLATGIGALPFFYVEEFSDRWLVGLWGLASGIMVSASLIGLIPEGIRTAKQVSLFGMPYVTVGLGLAIGVALVVIGERIIDDIEIDPGTLEEADLKKLILILGILTVHSFPEGVAIGVSFAELNLGTGLSLFGFMVPLIAITMTIAISIHNIPEGIAISIPFKAMGINKWKMLGATIFSSIPQPIGAVIAFIFVREARQFLPIGYGFAAGAMIFLVATEFVSEAMEQGEELPGGGKKEFIFGNLGGFAVMALLFFLL